MQQWNVKGMMELENLQWMLKLRGKHRWIARDLHSLKVSPHNWLIDYKGENSNLTVEKPVDHVNQVIKVTLTRSRTSRQHAPPDTMHWEFSTTYALFLLKVHSLTLDTSEASGQPRLKDSLQNNRLECSECVKVKKQRRAEELLQNREGWKDVKTQCNAES